MLLGLLLSLVPLLLGSSPAAQGPGGFQQGFGLEFGNQGKASARAWSRVEGGTLKLAVRIEIQPHWHLYHVDLGHPNGVGMPLSIELEGDGIEWSAVRLPEPKQFDQPEWDAFVLGHEGTIVLYAAGSLGEGADPASASITLSGLTCEDGGTCVKYDQTVSPGGGGPDELFRDFPEDLVSSAAVEDEHGGGEADASLYTRRDGRTVRAAIEVDITPGWHLYHKEKGNPKGIGKVTTVALAAEGVTFEAPTWPAPHELPQFGGVWIWSHEGRILLHADGTLDPGVDEPGPVSATIAGLTCEEGDGGVCIEYRETLVDRGRGEDRMFEPWREADEPIAESRHGETEDGSSGGEEEDDEGLLVFLLAAVGWGLFTLLMPCTYPMIPITISFFTKQAADRHGSVLPLSLAYGAGIVSIFVLIGVLVGPVIIAFATNPWTNVVIGGLFLYFSLVLFGIINLQPPRFLLDMAGKASARGGLLGVFLMGVTLVVTSFTCTAPFVGSLLAVGGVERDIGEIALGMGTFGLTMAIPFVVLSLVPGMVKNVPNSGQWMNTLKVFLGFVELAAALKFFSNSDLVWGWDVLSRELFLLLWVVIFVAAALFLFGLLPGKRAKPSALRGVGAFFMLLFSGYCAWGLVGNDMDRIMTAIVPNYSGGHLMPEWKEFEGEAVVVRDDYDQAVEQARAERKQLLVNFTGHT